ncbi:MAG: tRNA pseudouridine(38-40) synthase TruA [Bacteroidales bacterium]|jgi:tRNA pseudouridine38-40 synthase|nr:tRNA pseudouridine(38-40) synthase TruA [Bacteroidales bacterium]
MKFRYFIQLCYKGTNYHGWQIQPNAITVQEILTNAFSIILKENLEITGAGRTDTGVHASFFIAHFDSVKSDIQNDTKLLFKINGFLPKDIAIQKIFQVNNDAHARFDAINRTYQYFIHQEKDPFLIESSYFLQQILDLDLMNKACELLPLFTDFTSFSKLHTDVKTNNCKITHAFWTLEEHELRFTITADRFLRNMVRAIVGTLIDIGKKKITLKDFIQIIESKNRSDAGVSVPAHGLYLQNISYSDSIFKKSVL